MKVLVTGANGYLGRGIVKELLKRGFEVIATDIHVNDVDSGAIRIASNVFEISDPYTYFEQPDILLHLAWRDGFQHSSLNHMIDLPHHYIFLKNMVDAGLRQLCVMGSMHEVGFYEGSINENTPCNPLSLYGISKNALRNATELFLQERPELIFQWCRGYYIVANVSYGNSIFSKIALAAENGKKSFPFTMGENQFDFIDYDEFCKQVASVVGQSKYNGIINICSGRPMRLADRVEQFIKENQFPIMLEYGKFPDRPYDSKAVWGDDSKIKRIMQEYNT